MALKAEMDIESHPGVSCLSPSGGEAELWQGHACIALWWVDVAV